MICGRASAVPCRWIFSVYYLLILQNRNRHPWPCNWNQIRNAPKCNGSPWSSVAFSCSWNAALGDHQTRPGRSSWSEIRLLCSSDHTFKSSEMTTTNPLLASIEVDQVHAIKQCAKDDCQAGVLVIGCRVETAASRSDHSGLDIMTGRAKALGRLSWSPLLEGLLLTSHCFYVRSVSDRPRDTASWWRMLQ